MSKFKNDTETPSKVEFIIIISASAVIVSCLILALLVQDLLVLEVIKYIIALAFIPIIMYGSDGKIYKYENGKIFAINNPFKPKIY